MSLSKPKIEFKDAQGYAWDTHTAALISNALDDTYLDKYKKETIITILTTYFYIREKKDETIRTSKGSIEGTTS